ncbi:MAG: hypothetical protein RR231_09190 [Acinetobacter sp.]
MGEIGLFKRYCNQLVLFAVSAQFFTNFLIFHFACFFRNFISFSDFKNNLVSTVHGYSGVNRSMPYISSCNCMDTIQLYHKTIQDSLQICVDAIDSDYVEKIVRDMGGFNSIHFISNTAANVSGFQQNILMSGKNSLQITDVVKGIEMARKLNEHSLVISIISKLSESVVMLDVLKAVRASEASTLIITPAILSPYEKYADYLISYEGTGTSLDQYTITFCLNLLSMLYRSRYVD